MEYTSPGAALSQGLMQGVSLATNFQQIKAQREQVKWERDLKTAEMGMKLAENKNLPYDQRANAFNKGVRPVLNRMGIQMPEMTTATIKSDSFQEAVKNSNGIIDQMQSGAIDPHVGLKAITQHFTGALAGMDAENEAQKTQRELITTNANKYVDEADKSKARSTEHTPTSAEAIKRQSELQIQLANLNKTDMNSQITADALKKAGFNVDPGKVTPEMVDQVKGAVKKELSFLNQYLPDEYRHKEGISMAEAQALKKQGFSVDRMSRDFFVTDAPDGIDPLAMKAKGVKTLPMTPAPAPAPVPAPVSPVTPVAPPPAAAPRPVTPPPMATPAPMAAPAPATLPTAGPLSLSGGAVQPTQAGPLQLQNQSLQ